MKALRHIKKLPKKKSNNSVFKKWSFKSPAAKKLLASIASGDVDPNLLPKTTCDSDEIYWDYKLESFCAFLNRESLKSALT